ncbi:hypothetical protein OC842_001356 [Tilletia horrida]|uniref:Uncharacterized protein n=1 Tax=Tilletia horrida TaxID=155126 RepID=A0AAN6GFU2_9BASI|nr:hypothetical protein OC842_001356 [Tilletia horrida]
MDASAASSSNLAAAQGLVQAEFARQQQQNSSSGDARIPPPLDLAALPTLSTHFARLSTGTASASKDDGPKLDATRFTLPAPAAGLEASEDEWKTALDNAYVQLAHQEGRAINIDLMKKYGEQTDRADLLLHELALGRQAPPN